jgi:energy-coupling factor transporter ATP-binding protein EcfA2
VSPDSDPSAAAANAPKSAAATEGSSDMRPINASGAMGVQIGAGNTQFVYTYNRLADTDDRALPPAMAVFGTVESPYLGLNAFNERDAVFFFGRDDATTAVLERMSAELQASGLLVVSGASGAGKSSLLQAGVLPQLRGAGLKDAPEAAIWPCLMFTPGPAPLDELAVAVASVTGRDSAEVRRGLGSDPGRFRLTARQAAEMRSRDGGKPRLVLVIDQFEQLFTQCQDENERRAFLTAIASVTTAPLRQSAVGLVIMGVRADLRLAARSIRR